MAKIEVKNLTKIFGKKPKKAIPLLEEGYSKDEILEKTGNTVGVNSVDFSVEENEIFVIMESCSWPLAFIKKSKRFAHNIFGS